MKKTIWLLTMAILIVVSCQKQDKTNPITSDSNEKNTAILSNLASRSESCNISDGDSCTAPGTDPVLHTYRLIPIDISCAADNSTVTVIADPIDVPNKFTIVDQHNNFVAASGSTSYSYWIGSNCYGGSCFGGPWGGGNIPSPFNSGPNTFYFTKTAGTLYYLRVDAYIPDASFQHRTDGWAVNITCDCVEDPPTCNPCHACACEENGGSYSGTKPAPIGNPYPYSYTYPDEILDFSCLDSTDNGTLITVIADPIDVPNRFRIYDLNNNLIAASGSGSYSYWIGSNCYSSCFGGPWGGGNIPSPYNSGPNTFTFNYVHGTTYILRVDTYIPHESFQHRTDGWAVNINCDN